MADPVFVNVGDSVRFKHGEMIHVVHRRDQARVITHCLLVGWLHRDMIDKDGNRVPQIVGVKEGATCLECLGAA